MQSATFSSKPVFNSRGDRVDLLGRTFLADLDGLSLKSGQLPHPVDLATWQEKGFYTIDVGAGCFRLTAYGRSLARKG